MKRFKLITEISDRPQKFRGSSELRINLDNVSTISQTKSETIKGSPCDDVYETEIIMQDGTIIHTKMSPTDIVYGSNKAHDYQ